MEPQRELPQKLSHRPSYSQMDLLEEIRGELTQDTRVSLDVRTGRVWLSFLNSFGDEELRVEHNNRYVDTVNRYRVYNYDGTGLTEPHAELGLEEAVRIAGEKAQQRSLDSSF